MRTGAPLQASARPKAPLAKNLMLRHGRWVRKNIRKCKATRPRRPARSSPQEANTGPVQMSLKEVLRRVPGEEKTLASASGCDGSGSENVICALENKGEVQLCEDDACFVKSPTNNIDNGTLDLKGNPWIQPCDPRVGAIRINSSRSRMGSQPLNSAEVRGLVFRPSVFVWAPHLLSGWPFDLYDAYLLACVCVLLVVGSSIVGLYVCWSVGQL